jgi:hypothetical protein
MDSLNIESTHGSTHGLANINYRNNIIFFGTCLVGIDVMS